MKTFEEILAGNSLPDIAAMIAAHTKRIQAIQSEAAKRETKAATVEELTEWERLDDECEQLEAKRIELKKIEDRAKRQADRVKALTTGTAPVPFPGDNSQPSDNAPVVQFRGVASLKHITAETRQKAEEMAYRFFQFFAGGVMKNAHAAQWCKEHDLPLINASKIFRDEMKVAGSMNEAVNEQGAVLVPPEFDMMLIRLLETYGVFRKYTRMKPMASDTKNVPRRTGGVTAYWIAPGQTVTRSRPSYDNVGLVAKKLAALIAVDSELSEDSAISIADEIAFEIGYAFALAEDQAGFNGDGTSTYGGINGVRNKIISLSATRANIAGLVVGADNIYSGLTLANFNSVVGKLPQYADTPNAAWYAHKSFYHNVMQRLELAAGGVTAREVSEGDRRPRPLFLGYPVNFAQVMPSVEANDQVCCLFGDLSLASTMGDRRAVTLFNDPYSLAADDQIQVRGTERVDIVVHDVGNADATAANQVAGPIVGLLTAAS